MPRNTFSQVGGLASNPMNGVHNILLQPAAGDDAGQNLTMSRKDLLKILDEIADPNTETTEIHIDEVRKATEYFEDLIDDLNALYGALQNNTDSVATKDPISGETYKTGPQLAKELASRIRQMDSKETKSSKVFNFAKYAAAKGKAREEKTKKKTRGNPFRVLMGQVGKMLDHGISKKDIIRYIGKKNMWNDETIGKAVDVVMDYSKKTRSEEKKFQKTDKEASNSFNFSRFAAVNATGSIYDQKPDYTKRSTAELMARASWLNDLLNYNDKTPQGDGRKAASKDGVNAELKKIREALTKRGFEVNELP